MMVSRNKNFTAEELRNKKRFLGNSTAQVIGAAVNMATGMAITGILARYLGVAGYGELSLALVYFSFAGIIASLGYAAILVREVMKVDPRKHDEISVLATSGLVLHAVSSIVGVILLAAYIVTREYSASVQVQIVLLSLCHLSGMLGVFEFVFRIDLRLEYGVYASMAYRILHLLMICTCFYFRASLIVVIGTYLLANFLYGGIIYLFSRKIFRFQFRWDARRTCYIFREAFPLGVAGGLWIIYYRINILMLDWLKGVSAVAMYNAAFRFVDYAYLFSTIMMSSIYPLMASRYPGNPVGLKRIYQKSVDYVAIIGGGGSVLLLVLAQPVIVVLFGEGYEPAAATLRILCFIPLFILLNNVYGHILLVLEMQGRPLLLMRSCGVVINVGLNLVLIPRYSYYGAAWATVTTELVLLIMVPFIAGTRIKYRPSPRNFLLIFGFLAGAFGLVLGTHNPWMQNTLTIGGFVLVAGLFCRYNRDELWAMVFLKPREQDH